VSVVLRQRQHTVGYRLEASEAFARSLEAALRRQLPRGWTLVPDPRTPRLALERDLHGHWRLQCAGTRIVVDDLAVGASAARHLVALGARDLRYAGPAQESLRLRGFAIAAGALGCTAVRLDHAASPGGLLGVFADGAAGESAALAHLASAGFAVPRDALLLGIEDGALPAPRAPGLSRLRLDPDQIAQVAWAALQGGLATTVLIPPAGVVTRASSDHGGDDPHLAAAIAHLRANLHRPLDVDGLARAAGVPRRTLERLFRSGLGRSPLDEIRRQRIARAQELLAHSDLPLPQIASRTGFSTPDRLGVVFRQVTGTTPAAWRRQHRSAE
jgi:AraC-like DNA-binding protein